MDEAGEILTDEAYGRKTRRTASLIRRTDGRQGGLEIRTEGTMDWTYGQKQRRTASRIGRTDGRKDGLEIRTEGQTDWTYGRESILIEMTRGKNP